MRPKHKFTINRYLLISYKQRCSYQLVFRLRLIMHKPMPFLDANTDQVVDNAKNSVSNSNSSLTIIQI